MIVMTQRGQQLVEQLYDDLACPGCTYSLRGLPGEDVTCPECGQAVNVAAYVASRWTLPWWKAPLYNTLALPLAWLFLTVLVALVLLVAAMQGVNSGWFMLGTWLVIAAGLWIGILAHVRRRFGGDEGLWLALLIHLTLPLYLLGIAGSVGFAVRGLYDWSNRNWVGAAADCLWLAIFAGFVVAAWSTERFVARRCIRRHVRLRSAAARMPEP